MKDQEILSEEERSFELKFQTQMLLKREVGPVFSVEEKDKFTYEDLERDLDIGSTVDESRINRDGR